MTGVLKAKVAGEWVPILNGPNDIDIGALTEQQPTAIAKTSLGASTAPASTTTTLLDITMTMGPNEAGFHVSGWVGMVIAGVCDVTVIDFNGTIKCVAQVNGTAGTMTNAPLDAFCAKATDGTCRVRIQINTWGGVSAAINAKNSIVFQPVGVNFTLAAGGTTPPWPTRAPGGGGGESTPVWTPLVLPAPFAALGGSWAVPSYAVIGKMLHLRGSFASSGATAANQVIWEVPAHLHPADGKGDIFGAEALTNVALVGAPIARVDIRTGGTTGFQLTISVATTTMNHMSLAGIHWPVA